MLIAQGMTLYCCHNLLTGDYSFYDTCDAEELEMKFLAHIIEGKRELSTFS